MPLARRGNPVEICGMPICNRRGHLLRKCRFSEPGRIYLCTAVVHGRAPLFRNMRLGRLVVAAFRRSDAETHTQTLACVVMPDHFHWLLSLGAEVDLSSALSRAKSHSAWSINRALDRRGRVWQAGFHDHAVRRDEDLRHLARYVVMNPVRAGIVARIGDYALWHAAWL